jgi:hypothetical protein
MRSFPFRKFVCYSPQEFGLLLHPVHPLDFLHFSGFAVWSQQAASKRRSTLHQEL